MTSMQQSPLVIIGKKDLQIDWQTDGEKLQRAAAGHEEVTLLFPENAKHVLKEVLRPRSELVPAEMAEMALKPAWTRRP